MLANVMAMNYGFAFRLSAYRDPPQGSCGESFGAGDEPADRRLAAQLDLRGGRRRRHGPSSTGTTPPARTRHRAWRDHPVFGRIGQPLLLPGTNRTSLLPVRGRAKARAAACYSASHGAGLERSSASLEADCPGPIRERRSNASVPLFRCNGPVEVRQLDDRGVDDTLDILAVTTIAAPRRQAAAVRGPELRDARAVIGDERWRNNWRVVSPAGARSRRRRPLGGQRRRSLGRTLRDLPAGTPVVLRGDGARARVGAAGAFASSVRGSSSSASTSRSPPRRAPAYLVEDAPAPVGLFVETAPGRPASHRRVAPRRSGPSA